MNKNRFFAAFLSLLLVLSPFALAEEAENNMIVSIDDLSLTLPSTWISIDTFGEADETGLLYMGMDAEATMTLQLSKVTDDTQTIESLMESIQAFEGIQNITELGEDGEIGFSYETSSFICYVITFDQSAIYTLNFIANSGTMDDTFLAETATIAGSFQMIDATEDTTEETTEEATENSAEDLTEVTPSDN